jgi:regulator of protease activity HflC (stomatin/prohibitin superfamily)
MSFYSDDRGDARVARVVYSVTIGLVILVGILMAVVPNYTVWSKTRAGEAELRQAEYNRQIKVAEARAELESAGYRKEAAIIRAEGVAEANMIIGQSLSPQYIQWLWVDGLNDQNNQNQVIYVPNGGLLPVFDYNE